jgi:cadmium resistance transport/sequestration family protein
MQGLVQATFALQFTEGVIAGIIAFAASNIDDIVVLMLLFGQRERFQPRQVIAGQYLGFSILILASLPGFFGGLVLPRPWLGLLGLLPIAIGVIHLRSQETDDPTVQTVAIPTPSTEAPENHHVAGLNHWLNQPIAQVAAITIANGGDNIGIYVPLFANSSVMKLGIILLTFLVMIAVWCAIAYSLASHPALAKGLTRYGHRLVPFILIGLGLYILIESKSYSLVTGN